MQRITLIVATIASVLVIAYGGWLSAATSSDSGAGNDGTSQTEQGENGRGGKPGEAPKP